MVEELGERPEQIEARCRADYARSYGRAKPAKSKGKGKRKNTAKKKT